MITATRQNAVGETQNFFFYLLFHKGQMELHTHIYMKGDG